MEANRPEFSPPVVPPVIPAPVAPPVSKPTPRLRVLVLTSSTGSGHDNRAYAFRQWVDETFPGRADVRVEHILERSSPLLRFGVHLYNFIHRRAPFLHNIYWCIVEMFGYLQGQRLSWGRCYYERFLKSYRPHLILSFHDSTNRGYFALAKKVLGKDQVRTATYCGEWTGGFGYSRIWLTPQTDRFVSRTAEADGFAGRCGIAEARRTVFCNMLTPAIFEERVPWEHRQDVRIEEFGLDPEKFTVLLTTGGFGANHHLHFLSSIRHLGDRVQAIVVCGRNDRIYLRLLGWIAANPELNVHLEGYSRQVHRLMQISDAVVTRGGANTTAEALYYGCPIVFTGLGGVMPQERLTIRYFTARNASALIRSTGDFRRLIEEWSEFPTAYTEIKDRLALLRRRETPETFVEEMLDLAAEVVD